MTAPRPSPLLRLLVALAGAGLVVASCSSGDGDARVRTAASGASTTTAAPAPPGPLPVGTRTDVLVDPTRPTPGIAGTGVPAANERVLETTYTFPDADGPFPLIVFAHGHNGHPRKFGELFAAWAGAGFVVAAPAFPLSNDEVPGAASPLDLSEQPGDVSAVLSEALRRNDEPGDPLAGRIDPERLAVGGLSLGGATTYLAAFDDCCRDERFDAAMVLDGLRPDPSGLDLAIGLPLLVVHADADPVAPYAPAAEAFAAAAAPTYLLTLHEDVHASPFEDAPDPADELVAEVTTAFWRHHLAGDATAASDLEAAATARPRLATWRARPA
ncbi:MAG: hypothetical protein KDB10_15605 [Acidimicrobiales bacterium]|nr:hypothetical protein [Acidimicrobiales bacterium]MCB9371730.1 hypothetical protein [Microthrixaceae bacterium]